MKKLFTLLILSFIFVCSLTACGFTQDSPDELYFEVNRKMSTIRSYEVETKITELSYFNSNLGSSEALGSGELILFNGRNFYYYQKAKNIEYSFYYH